MKNLLSILIPIYNVEKYLRECLNSVCNQTLKDIEIICINDGSTDGSLNIINEFAEKDNRIKIINKTNSGYGASMNKGLEIATGEFIGIVESDDFVKPEMFEILYKTAKEQNVNLVKSNFNYYWTKNNRIKQSDFIDDSMLNRIIKPIEDTYVFEITHSIWSSIYKREFIEQNNIRFNETPGASYQDTAFNFKCWAMCGTAYFIKDAFLFYRQDNAQSSSNNKNKIFCICDEYREIEKFLDAKPELKNKLEIIKNKAKSNCYNWNYNRLKGENRKIFLKEMSNEYKQDILDNKINKTCFLRREWEFYKYIAYHDDMFYRLKFYLYKILSFIFNIRKKNQYKRYYLFNLRILKIKCN